MQLTEKHRISKSSEFYELLDHEAYKSKNLYNSALYAIRQYYFENKKYLPYVQVYKLFFEQHQQDY